MFRRWQWLAMAALMISVPLAVGPARAAQAKKKPAAKATKPHAKTAKTASRSHSRSVSKAMVGHRPPTPPPPPHHSSFDVPQAKSLAATPDVVLNSRVRASLMADLSAAKVQDIEPTTVNHVVTLAGSVKSKELRARAEQVARKVRGVRAVKNELVVK